MKLRVWVIEGDEALRGAIDAHLTSAGMEVRSTFDARALQGWLDAPPDVAVCNAELPGESGLSVAAWLRMSTPAGVILLVDGQRRDDRVLGLSLGVDHCLALPADFDELGLLVRNLHRRIRAADDREPSWPPAAGEVQAPAGAWSFDASRWELIAPSGASTLLSMAEHLIVGRLFESAGEVVSRDALLVALKGRKISVYSRNLDMIVSRLRKKVERACGERLPVLSARGIGYVFTGRCRISRATAPRVVPVAQPLRAVG